jgi:hypothetical protein
VVSLGLRGRVRTVLPAVAIDQAAS